MADLGERDFVMVPSPTNLSVISEVPGKVQFSFTGDINIDHYDIYRSLDPNTIGIKINTNPVSEPVSPYLCSFSDDGINSIQAPVSPDVYFYRVVAIDGSGNISFPTDALAVAVNLPQEITPPQAKISKIETRGN